MTAHSRQKQLIDTEAAPALDIRSPDGGRRRVRLRHDRVTIGRLTDVNDVALTPDPQRLISGRWHCAVELKGRSWSVVDNHSTNGTFLLRGEHLQAVREHEPLHHGDVIHLIAGFSPGEQPTYWKLTFCHPGQTVPVATVSEARLEYDWSQARPFRITATAREEITGLRPQVHQLLRFMLARNRANDDTPVLCGHEELIAEIWPHEAVTRSREELARLAMELRRCIELDPANPRFLRTVRGFGFCLDPRPSQGRWGS